MVLTMKTDEQRESHARRQKEHEMNKKKTHVRRQVWVPRSQTEVFAATMKRLQKRWAKEAQVENAGV